MLLQRLWTTPLCLLLLAAISTQAFAPSVHRGVYSETIAVQRTHRAALWMSAADDDDDDVLENSGTQERIKELVESNPILLFMKGSKLFPQCGFSNTATQILMSFNVDFHTVDVLADEEIRQGVKEFSQWPTIPQLYVDGEFIGGSDIMIEMYQSGELGEMVEKANANQM